MAKRNKIQNGRRYFRDYQPKQVEVKSHTTTVKKIEKIEKAGVQQLKLTTENGTICTISDKYYREENWEVLWDYLAVGDPIEIDYRINKILGADVPVTQTQYQLVCCFMKDDVLRLCFEAEEDKLIEPINIAKRKNTTTDIWLSEVFCDGLRYIGTLEDLERELDDADDVKVTVSSIGNRKVRVDLEY